MLPLLYHRFRDTIDGSTLLGPLGVFSYIEFRAVVAIILSFTIVVLMGRRTIAWLIQKKIGDQPEFHHKDVNELMREKRHTPTMGGILIIGAVFASTVLLADLRPSHGFYIWMALVALIWLLAMGVADDWLKLTGKRKTPGSRHGLTPGEKLLLQIGLGLVLGVFVYQYGGGKVGPDDPESLADMARSLTLPFFKTWVQVSPGVYEINRGLIVLPMAVFVAITVLVMTFSSNAVNLTDGMDGLAGGVMVIVAFAFMMLALIAGFERDAEGLHKFVLAKYLLVPYIPHSDELAVIAGAMVGACLGFLWFNCNPAQVFMGDSGSLPLGGLIGFIAVVIRQEFLLLVIGGVFVMEAGSVMIQVSYFRLTGGKRVFRCTPIHHHFHLAGWTEQQIVVRFWLLTALFVAVALATIKVR